MESKKPRPVPWAGFCVYGEPGVVVFTVVTPPLRLKVPKLERGCFLKNLSILDFPDIRAVTQYATLRD